MYFSQLPYTVITDHLMPGSSLLLLHLSELLGHLVKQRPAFLAESIDEAMSKAVPGKNSLHDIVALRTVRVVQAMLCAPRFEHTAERISNLNQGER
jgi:hypothetical protein